MIEESAENGGGSGRQLARTGPVPSPYRLACRSVRWPATRHRCGSTQPLAQPGCARRRRLHRPVHDCGGTASLQFDADISGRHFGLGLHIERDEAWSRQGRNFGFLRRRRLTSSARRRCTTFAFRLYSLAIAAADASGRRHACRTSALNCALCLRRVARLTTPSIVSTSFITDTMPADSQAIKMTSPRAYVRNLQTREIVEYLTTR